MDALLLGDENAKTLGVQVTRLRILSLAICAALTACIVSYCGGIGFVGLMIPHIVRSWLGVTSRIVTIGCVLLGGCFMVWVDVLARVALPNQEIPIGIITSAIGSVFFLIVMSQRRN
jgi:iron complex transport system permease protein